MDVPLLFETELYNKICDFILLALMSERNQRYKRPELLRKKEYDS